MRTLHMLHSLDVAPGDTATTVRNGFKWADLATGEHIELCVCTRDPETHDVQGEGRVEQLWFGRFRDIPAWYLSFEHDLTSRDYSGLFGAMRRAYGDKFGEWSPVTVVMYERMK